MTTVRDPDDTALSALATLARGLMADRGAAPTYQSAKHALREALARDPLDSLVTIALGGSYLFYLAEKDTNPRCRSIWDALVFITTCLSVGYHDVLAHTKAGKAIAAFVMTVGPSLAAKALDPPVHTQEAGPRIGEEAILARLDTLISLLQNQATGTDGGSRKEP